MSKSIEKCSYDKCRYPKKLIILADRDQIKKIFDGKPYHDVCLIRKLAAGTK